MKLSNLAPPPPQYGRCTFIVLAVTEPPSYRDNPIVGNLRITALGKHGVITTWHDWMERL